MKDAMFAGVGGQLGRRQRGLGLCQPSEAGAGEPGTRREKVTGGRSRVPNFFFIN